jgi:hypothetical protein
LTPVLTAIVRERVKVALSARGEKQPGRVQQALLANHRPFI